MLRRLPAVIGMALLIAALLPLGAAAREPSIDVRTDFKLDKPVTSREKSPTHKLDRSLLDESRRVDVVIQLSEPPTARVRPNQTGRALGRINGQQNAVMAALRKLDSKTVEHGRTRVALNSLLVRADAAALAQLAADDRVTSINRVRDYELDLAETVPFIGAAELQGAGLTGEGVRVAVLDSGIDYTHAAFGGPGTVKAYEVAYGKKTTHQQNRMINESFQGSKLFPNEKVIGGYDFVGEAWPFGPLRPDPDPIDCSPTVIGCDGGHGTNVADIIGGIQEGKPGVAPGVKFYAVKVCSALSTACSGVALIQGMDFALDPNRDGNPVDRVDIINMSLGSNYGTSPDDDLSQAVENATALGVLTVASSGNSGDKPYATGTPGAAPSALSVAQTGVPSAKGFAMLISTDGSEPSIPREAVHQPWSKEFTPDDEVTNVPVQYGDGSGGNLLGCSPFAAGSLAGKVVLVDRGVCFFSDKIANIANAGGKIGVIGLVTPGDPFEGGLGDCPGGGCHNIPGFMVSQSTANLMRNANARVTFSEAGGIDMVGHMVGSSSRGPDNALNLIKPEIGAPGASVSASAGTGTGNEPFGGTSGAAPMVAGSAALLLQAYPNRSPLEIKAALMNTGDPDILNRPLVFGGEIAPITRIGGGEVRVNRAHATSAVAWVQGSSSSALSFGFHDVSESATLTQTVVVRNYGGSSISYDISHNFRFANDAANGAVSVSHPSSVNVPAGGSSTFSVTLDIDAASLRDWELESGFTGASGATLQLMEFDGYIQLNASGSDNDIHLPWQVLPRLAGDISASSTSVDSGEDVTLTNNGEGVGWVSSFNLVAESPQTLDTGPGDNLSDVDLKYVGVRQMPGGLLGCDSPVALSFATTTWSRTVHANVPALFEFLIDVNQDGTDDYSVFNFDLSLSDGLGDGRNLTWAENLNTGEIDGFFFTQHSTNSANTILTICGEQIGLTAASLGSTVSVVALAADWANSGAVTDSAEFEMVIGADRYTASFSTMDLVAPGYSPVGTVVIPGLPDVATVTDNGTEGTTDGIGLLLTLDGNLFFPGGSDEDNATLVITINEP